MSGQKKQQTKKDRTNVKIRKQTRKMQELRQYARQRLQRQRQKQNIKLRQIKPPPKRAVFSYLNFLLARIG